MSKFQHVAKIAAVAAVAVLTAAGSAAAQQGGKYWVPTEAQSATHDAPRKARVVAKAQKQPAAAESRKRTARTALARLEDGAAGKKKEHHLILQVNTNDPAAMNLALNNASNVTQYYKDAGEKVKVEVVTFGPGLHMLRNDTSPVKARIEEMALSAPEVSFKACGNTQERMHLAEKKDIPIIPQATVVKSGVVRIMELQEMGWTYVKP